MNGQGKESQNEEIHMETTGHDRQSERYRLISADTAGDAGNVHMSGIYDVKGERK